MLMRRELFGAILAGVFLFSIIPLSYASSAIPSSGSNHNVAQLLPADPDWGSPIPGSWGYVKYFQTADGFKGKAHLRGLLPNHEYTFCINGKPGMPGTPSDYHTAGISFYDDPYGWTTPGGSWGAEEFCDFWLITTNNSGDWSGSFEKVLPQGEYQVKFFVKDAHAWDIYMNTGQWKTIVLYNNDVAFTIEL